MSYFTDSPYERMMTQKPETVREALTPPALPPEHPCLGICYRELLKKRSDKKRSL